MATPPHHSERSYPLFPPAAAGTSGGGAPYASSFAGHDVSTWASTRPLTGHIQTGGKHGRGQEDREYPSGKRFHGERTQTVTPGMTAHQYRKQQSILYFDQYYPLLEQTFVSACQVIQTEGFEQGIRLFENLDGQIGNKWRFHRMEKLNEAQKQTVFDLRGLGDCCEWALQKEKPPNDWCDLLGKSRMWVISEDYRKALSFVRVYLAEARFHSEADREQRLYQALDYLEWIRLSRSLSNPQRAIWLDCYITVCRQLASYPHTRQHDLFLPWADAERVINEIDRCMNDKPGNDPMPALECLQHVLHRVRDEGFTRNSLLILASATRYATRKYTFHYQAGPKKDFYMKLGNVYYFSTVLLLFGFRGSHQKDNVDLLINLGRLRVPFNQIEQLLGELLDSYYQGDISGITALLERGFAQQCCLLVDKEYRQALLNLSNKDYQLAEEKLGRLESRCERSIDRSNVLRLAKAWCCFLQGRYKKAQGYLNAIIATSMSAMGFQQMLLQIHMKTGNATIPPVSKPSTPELDDHFYQWDLLWLSDLQQGVRHSYLGADSEPRQLSTTSTIPLPKFSPISSAGDESPVPVPLLLPDSDNITRHSSPAEQQFPDQDSASTLAEAIDMEQCTPSSPSLLSVSSVAVKFRDAETQCDDEELFTGIKALEDMVQSQDRKIDALKNLLEKKNRQVKQYHESYESIKDKNLQSAANEKKLSKKVKDLEKQVQKKSLESLLKQSQILTCKAQLEALKAENDDLKQQNKEQQHQLELKNEWDQLQQRVEQWQAHGQKQGQEQRPPLSPG